MTPEETEAVLTAWKAKEARADSRFALIAASVFQSQGAKKKDGRPFTVADFMPRDKKAARANRRRQMQANEANLKAGLMALMKQQKTS